MADTPGGPQSRGEAAGKSRGHEAAARAEEGREMPVAALCGLCCLFSICILLIYTEIFRDASVRLQTFKLLLLGAAAVPFLAPSLCTRRVATVAAAVATAVVLLDCVLLMHSSNRVSRFYLRSPTLTAAQKQTLARLFSGSRVVLLAGEEPAGLPAEIEAYTELSQEERQILNRRLGSKTAAEDPKTLQFTANGLRHARFSGIRDRLLLIIGRDVVNEKNHEEFNFQILR